MAGKIGMPGDMVVVGAVTFPSIKAAYRAKAKRAKAGEIVNYITFYKRITKGWSAADAFHKPVRAYNQAA